MRKFTASMVVLLAPVMAQASDLPSKKSVPVTKSMAPMTFSGDLSVGLSYDNWSGVYDLGDEVKKGGASTYAAIDGRALLPFSDNLGIQLDGSANRTIENSKEITSYSSASHIGAHALYRTNSYQFGFFGGLGTALVDTDEEWRSNIFGVEAQAYLNNVTVWAQIGRASTVETSWTFEKYTPIQSRLGVRYFFDNNTRFDVEAGYTTGNANGSTGGSYGYVGGWGTDFTYRADLVNWKAGLEHLFKMNSVPVSIFANYSGAALLQDTGISNDCSCDSWTWKSKGMNHAVTIGFSLKFGTDSLLQQDRNGTNTDMNFSHLPVIDSLYGTSSVINIYDPI